MVLKDPFPDLVHLLIEKDGWTITELEFTQAEDVDFFRDSRKDRVLAAEKAGQKIVVQIQSYPRGSGMTDFHSSLGQFLTDRSALRLTQPERVLYLAVSIDIYQVFFERQFIQRVIAEHQLKFLIFNENREKIVSWDK
ncbi:MAG: element excision factor XisH family protein [Microcoleus sp.]